MAIKKKKKTLSKNIESKYVCMYLPMYYYIIPLDTTFRIEYTYSIRISRKYNFATATQYT